MGGEAVTSGITVDGNTITIAIGSVTGNVVIKVPTKPIAGEKPETPTTYTFTINPDPVDATVTLSATGYSTVSGTGSKSITVANGTKVDWSVSADGYNAQEGSWTANGSDESKDVKLVTTELTSHTVTSDMITQGGWGYYEPTIPTATNRLRTKELILIPSGSTVTWDIPSNLKCTISLLKEDKSTDDMNSFVFRQLWATGSGSHTTSEAAYLHFVWALAEEGTIQVSNWSGTYTY